MVCRPQVARRKFSPRRPRSAGPANASRKFKVKKTAGSAFIGVGRRGGLNRFGTLAGRPRFFGSPATNFGESLFFVAAPSPVIGMSARNTH